MFSVVLLLPFLQALDLPLAPYNIKVFCRQGRRYSQRVRTALQCTSSTTACGFFEFKSPDSVKGIDTIGVYECVDNGILKINDSDSEEDYVRLFTQLCGATPQCSYLNLNKLNPAFVKYLIIHHDIQLEALTSHTIRFCCSLFHHTLQKLVTSEKDRLPVVSAPPVHCESEMCEADAVGCLLHSVSNEESDDYYDDDDDDDDDGDDNVDADSNMNNRHERTRQKRQHNRHHTEYDEQINAVQLFFDYEENEQDPSLQFVTRSPSPSASSSLTTPPPSSSSSTSSTSSWSSSSLPLTASRLAVMRKPLMVAQTPPHYNRSSYVSITSRNPMIYDDEYEELKETEEIHCVYRHLNDELYRYCLLVHQRKDGDRCYVHEGHTICCCFVPPDKETCDPKEINLVRPLLPTGIPPIRVTPWSNAAKIFNTAKSTPTTTTTTSTTTTTTTIRTTSAAYSKTVLSFPNMRKTKSHPKLRLAAMNTSMRSRCRITYPRKKTIGSRVVPLLVCDSAYTIFTSLLLLILVLHCILF